MRLAKITSLAVLAVLLSAFGCSSGGSAPDDDDDNPPRVPSLSATRAFMDLQAQVAFGPRNPGSDGHEAQRAWMVEQMTAAGATVTQQQWTFDSVLDDTFDATNVLAEFAPAAGRQAAGTLLIGAHWDTRPVADQDDTRRDEPILGANDGASGVAVLMELARIFRQQAPPRRVILAFFDLEDLGLTPWTTGLPLSGFSIGSRHFAANMGDLEPDEAIIVDMVGDANLSLPQEQWSLESHPELVHQLWSRAQGLGFSQFLSQVGLRITDDHVPLIQVGVPAVDIIDLDYPGPGSNRYWHTHDDVVANCSPASLRAVGQTLVDYLYGPTSSRQTLAPAGRRGAWRFAQGMPAHALAGADHR